LSEPRYLIYSLTKTFIAVLFCRLADRGVVSLADPLETWLDAPRLPRASLRTVLDHTAGIPDYADETYAHAVRTRPSDPWSDEELLLHGVAREPAGRWTYSNTGYLLLRRILDDLERDGFAGALLREVTRPLGMIDTTLALELDDLEGLAPGLSTQVGSGRQDVRGRYQPSYGLGVMADPEWPYGVLIGHGGGGPGYGAAAFALVRPEPLVAVVLKGEDGDGHAEAEAIGLLETQVKESGA
jgi:D-alanyl-D-alanine carboxypeptidase